MKGKFQQDIRRTGSSCITMQKNIHAKKKLARTMRHSSPSIRRWKKQSQPPVPEVQPKTWNRSDTISTLSVVFAALAFGVAYFAETRVVKTDRREVDAVAIAVGSKVRSIANGAGLSARFMQGFIDHKVSNPKDSDQIDAYIIELAGDSEFPELTVLPEQVAALARVDSDAAASLAACSDRRADIQIDFKKLADAKPGRLTNIQLSTAQVIPYRLRELKVACEASLKSLVVLLPQLPKIMGPVRGTIGELIEADSSSHRERESGRHMELHLGERMLQNGHNTSNSKRRESEVTTNPKDK